MQTHMGMTFVETYDPVTAEELGAKYPGRDCRKVPGLQWHRVPVGRGVMAEVVLMRDATVKPRLEVYHRVEATLDEHRCRPENCIRPGQGMEFWSTLLQETLRTQPLLGAGHTWNDFEILIGHRPGDHTGTAAGTTQPRGREDEPVEEVTQTFIIAAEDDGDILPQADVVTPTWSGLAESQATPETRESGSRGYKKQRRLRNNTSNPTDPSSVKKSRASGKEVLLTVENVLTGQVHQPKVQIYHRRQRLPTFKKSNDMLAVYNEEAALRALEAAEALQPSEMQDVTEEVFRESMKEVLAQLTLDRFPREVLLGVLRRRAGACMDNPDKFLEIWWPWGADVAVCDPFNARLRDMQQLLASEGSSHDELATLVSDSVIKNYLTKHMAQKATGITPIAKMRDQLCQAATDARVQNLTGKAAETVANLVQVVLGLAAAVQSEAVTPEQLSAFTAMDDGKNKTAAPLEPLWNDPWWKEKRAKVWDTAAVESVARPIMDKAMVAWKESQSSRQDVAEAWRVVQSQYNKWTTKTRAGSTDELVNVMVTRLLEDVKAVGDGEISTEFIAYADQLRTRIMWVSGLSSQTEAKLQSAREVVADIMQTRGGQQKLQIGIVQIDGLLEQANSGDVSHEHIQDLLKTFQECKGLEVSDAIAVKMCDMLHMLQKIDDATGEVCELALIMLELVPVAYAETRQEELQPEQEWKLLQHGIRLQQLMATPEAARNKDTWRADAAHALAKWMGVVASHTPTSQQASELVAHAEGVDKVLTEHHDDRIRLQGEKLTGSLNMLQTEAMGLQGTSWKAKLNETSTWEDVAREAGYHLFPVGQTNIMKTIDAKFDQVCKDYAAWEHAHHESGRTVSENADLKVRYEETCRVARVTHTEAYFIEILSSVPKEKLKPKIRHRIASMAQPEKQVNSDDVFPVLWQRVMAENRS